MALAPPLFAKGEAIDAVAEFRTFASAVGDPAAHLLAELTEIHNRGNLSDIPPRDISATKVRGLCCRRTGGWAVFYSYEGHPSAGITVVLVAKLNPHAFGTLESEAENRLRRLSL